MITRVLIVLGALIVLASLNVSILGKERLKRDGQVTYLELAPRDPRSLMQGDYMALRFRLAQDIESTWASGRNEAGRDARTAPPTALDAVPHGNLEARTLVRRDVTGSRPARRSRL